jgi:hypothetical protein
MDGSIFPIRRICAWCDEKILPTDKIHMLPPSIIDAMHVECLTRGVVGGLNHLQGNCSCCGGTEPPDPPNLTKRQAAIAAYEYFNKHGFRREGV